MLTLDEQQIRLALMSLRHTHNTTKRQRDGTGSYIQIGGGAWYCCDYCVNELEVLIDRMELALKEATR